MIYSHSVLIENRKFKIVSKTSQINDNEHNLMTVILRSTSKRESAHLNIVQNGVLSDVDKFDISVSKKIQLPICIYLSETSAICVQHKIIRFESTYYKIMAFDLCK